MTHKPGKANAQADALSWMSNLKVPDAQDNRQQIVLMPEWFARLAASSFVNPLEGRIREVWEREAEVLEALEQLKKDSLKKLANGLPEWQEDNGLVYHRGRVYIPNDLEL